MEMQINIVTNDQDMESVHKNLAIEIVANRLEISKAQAKELVDKLNWFRIKGKRTTRFILLSDLQDLLAPAATEKEFYERYKDVMNRTLTDKKAKRKALLLIHPDSTKYPHLWESSLKLEYQMIVEHWEAIDQFKKGE